LKEFELKQLKICASCQQENEPLALSCSNCGMPFQFDVRTPNVAVELKRDPSTQEIERSLKKPPPPNIIALHVVSDPSPILVPYQHSQRIILGRDIPEGDFLGVDLTHYRAQVLGVSRQHAIIRITDEGCVLEDLNSTNGTWLNETRLVPQQPHPLQSSDLMRLGHLMIFVSFRE
jgi:hypothetical protein